jgi:hypothetical protein
MGFPLFANVFELVVEPSNFFTVAEGILSPFEVLNADRHNTIAEEIINIFFIVIFWSLFLIIKKVYYKFAKRLVLIPTFCIFLICLLFRDY